MTNTKTAIPRPKPWIANIHAYVPGKAKAGNGGDGVAKPVKLSANENPLGASPKAVAALAENPAQHTALYPDPDAIALREGLANTHGLPAEQIVCGTGSGELLNLAAQGYAGPGDDILYVRYGFSLYEIIARKVGARPVAVPDNNYGTDIDAILDHVTPATRLIFLANPNNPTGTLLHEDAIARLHAALPSDVLLVLDQAYGEYLPDDHWIDGDPFHLARQADNVLVTRTFSKIYGLAAQRIGWAFGAPGLIDTLNRIRGPFNVSSSGQAAALAALSDKDFVFQARAHNSQWRQWLTSEITALGNYGLSVVAGHGNFLLVNFAGPLNAQTAYEKLMAAGYITRWLPGQGLPESLRITIGTGADMRGLKVALRKICEGHPS